MSFEITGKLIEVYPITAISDKFKKREFVIEKTETKNSFDFIDYIKFQVTQEKCNLTDLFKKGDLIKVSFNLRGRKWDKEGTVNYFTNLEAWKIEQISASKGNPENGDFPAADLNLPDTSDFSSSAEEIDDLPF
jgi:hypothetical protein